MEKAGLDRRRGMSRLSGVAGRGKAKTGGNGALRVVTSFLV